METEIRICCPDCSKSKEERIGLLFNQIEDWIASEALECIVNLFGGSIQEELTLIQKIDYLNEFANVWDYRKKQADGGERWKISDEDFVKKNKEIIMDSVTKLGLDGIVNPLEKPDYILPLGGARLSNLERCRSAKCIFDSFGDNSVDVVALSGKRQIDNIEKEYLEQYAPEAATEFDAMNRGLEEAFDLYGCSYSEEGYVEKNNNLSWAIRKYKNSINIFSIAASASDPSRRANSKDTFDFFMDNFNIKSGEKLLLVTSCIYVPFQFLKFMDIAIESNIYIDCVGVPNNNEGVQFSKVSNYLQEVKATINAISYLSDKYLKEKKE